MIESSGLNWFVVPLLVPFLLTVHAFGRAVVAQVGGFRISSIRLGRGKAMVGWSLSNGTLVQIGPWILFGAATSVYPRGLGMGLKAAWVLGGGAWAQLCLAVLLFFGPQNPTLELTATLNLLFLAWNLIPWKLGGVASDGWRMLVSMGGLGHVTPLLVAQTEAVALAQDMAKEHGDTLGLWNCRLRSVWIHLEMGQTQLVESFLGDQYPPNLACQELALAASLRSWLHRLERRPLAALREARVSGEQWTMSKEAAGLMSLSEARAFVALGESGRAQKVLARAVGLGGVLGREALIVRLEAALIGEDLQEMLGATYRVVKMVEQQLCAGLFLEASTAAATLWNAGQTLKQSVGQESLETLILSERALAASSILARRMVDAVPVGERSAFGRHLGPVLERRGNG